MNMRIGMVGDVFIEREDPDETLRRVAPLFADLDVVLANSEGVYAHQTSRPPSAAHQVLTEPRCAVGIKNAGIHAVSVANNHTVDGGHEGLLETLEVLRGLGLPTAGGGRDIAEAREPAVVHHDAGTVALLAYSSVFPVGFEARAGVPGVAPLRVDTFYALPDTHFWTPGVPPRMRTMPWEADMEALAADVARARESADTVVVSVHWGDSFVPLQIQDYLRDLGRGAVDAGADIVFGHHHHSLRGMEVYRGRPIFYGLGNFAFDLWHVEDRWPAATFEMFRKKHGEFAFGPRPGFPSFPFHEDYRKTAIAVVELAGGRLVRSGFVPCMIRPDGPEPLGLDHPERAEVFDYLVRATAIASPTVRLEPSGGGNVGGIELIAAVPE
ncbi:MAG: CapA family protein [Actinomycetota bacterium]|nr:CapA family protein [Actinomycetota bacterium]